MRTLMIAAIVAATAFGGTAADAQRIGGQGKPPMGGWRQPMPMPQPAPMPAPRPNPGGWNGQPRPNPQPMPRPNPGGWQGGQWQGGNSGGQWRGRSRWGNRVGGFWWGGVQAPGGWNGYSRVKRGRRLTGYWLSPNFLINDWQVYGLGAPPSGYYWSRYYNDAVLLDRDGQVYDSVGGIDWDRYQGGYGYDDQYGDGGPGPGYAEGPGYGAGYPAPGYGGSSSSTQTYTYTTGGYGGGPGPMPRIAYGNTYYTSPGSVVTITMPGAVTTTTTTTTEYVYERRYVAKRVWRKPVRRWRPKPRCSCAPRPILGS